PPRCPVPRRDPAVSRSARTRRAALRGLRLALSSRTLARFLLERRLTLAGSLEKSLRRGAAGGGAGGPGAEGSLVLLAGKGDEQALAGTVLTLLRLQTGSGTDGEEAFRSLKPLPGSVLTDGEASPGPCPPGRWGEPGRCLSGPPRSREGSGTGHRGVTWGYPSPSFPLAGRWVLDGARRCLP
ncbi:interferon-related developmental regulator 2-like, partial [Opisthocomus hoazin]|uniref:interferon-related developmental regulator 2-like n=1 Tax=Opisthocomus hoazin TaxID=30419 RepID=UPI003F530FCE